MLITARHMISCTASKKIASTENPSSFITHKIKLQSIIDRTKSLQSFFVNVYGLKQPKFQHRTPPFVNRLFLSLIPRDLPMSC